MVTCMGGQVGAQEIESPACRRTVPRFRESVFPVRSACPEPLLTLLTRSPMMVVSQLATTGRAPSRQQQ